MKRLINKKKLNLGVGKKVALFGLLAVISVSAVFTTIQTSTIGAKLQYLEEKERKIDETRRALENELSHADSLSRISQEADYYQYTKPLKVVYTRSDKEVGMSLH